MRAIVMCLVLTLSMSIPRVGAADDGELKSETVGWVLAVDPLPADALYHSGRIGEGTLNLACGVLGAGIFFGALRDRLDDDPSTGNSGFGDQLTRVNTQLLIGGAALYIGALVWDGTRGHRHLRQHNERVLEGRRLLPAVSLSSRGTPLAGFELRF